MDIKNKKTVSHLKFILLFAAIITMFFTVYGSLNPKILISLFVIPLGTYQTYILVQEFRNRKFTTSDATQRTVKLTGKNAQIAAAIMLLVTLLWLLPAILYMINTDYPQMILGIPAVEENVVAASFILMIIMIYYGYLVIYKNEYRYKYPQKSSLTLFGRKWF